MIKKRKKQSKYILRNKEFTTFEEMKTYAYFNISVGTKEEALEIIEDEIIKKYELIKQERRRKRWKNLKKFLEIEKITSSMRKSRIQ